MTSSLSSLVGQPLTWVPNFRRFELIAPDNSVIATYPVEVSRGLGQRLKKAKALVPDGTGTLFLYREGEGIAISAVEQGPRLATYKLPWLKFPDGRAFWWGQDKRKRVWSDPTTIYVRFSDVGFSRKVHVEIYPPAAEIPELSLLLVLGLENILIERVEATIELGIRGGGAAGWGLSHH